MTFKFPPTWPRDSTSSVLRLSRSTRPTPSTLKILLVARNSTHLVSKSKLPETERARCHLVLLSQGNIQAALFADSNAHLSTSLFQCLHRLYPRNQVERERLTPILPGKRTTNSSPIFSALRQPHRSENLPHPRSCSRQLVNLAYNQRSCTI